VYPHQTDRLTAVLEREGLEALIAATPANIRYVTGFRSLVEAVFHTRQFAVFARRGTALVVPAVDVLPLVLDAVPVDHIVCFGGFVLPASDRPMPGLERVRTILEARAQGPADAVARALDALDVRSGRVGVDEAGVPPPSWTALIARLAPREVLPAFDHLLAARRVKAPYELECLERALHITEEALNSVIQVLKPGFTEREAVRLYETEVLKRGAETYPAIVAFGERSAVPAPWPTDRALRSSDLVRFDLGCVFKGYWASLARTAVMGTPDERQQRVTEAVEAGLKAALDAIRPGVPAARVHQEALEATRAGLPAFRRAHIGHGIGLEPYERPKLSAGIDTPLEAGEVLRVEMPYYEPGWGAAHLLDTVLVTTRGHHVLNRSVRGPVVLD
jgi:Xaa-Pro aminopeptidase